METLYKGKYLIAVYDKDDNFIDCATNIVELKVFKPQTYYGQATRKDITKHKFRKGYKVFLIDCLEKHYDIFAEEDEIFLNEQKICNSKMDIYEKLTKKYGKSLRTIQRWVSIGKINIDNELKGVS